MPKNKWIFHINGIIQNSGCKCKYYKNFWTSKNHFIWNWLFLIQRQNCIFLKNDNIIHISFLKKTSHKTLSVTYKTDRNTSSKNQKTTDNRQTENNKIKKKDFLKNKHDIKKNLMILKTKILKKKPYVIIFLT